jgi:hypothetical protein
VAEQAAADLVLYDAGFELHDAARCVGGALGGGRLLGRRFGGGSPLSIGARGFFRCGGIGHSRMRRVDCRRGALRGGERIARLGGLLAGAGDEAQSKARERAEDGLSNHRDDSRSGLVGCRKRVGRKEASCPFAIAFGDRVEDRLVLRDRTLYLAPRDAQDEAAELDLRVQAIEQR